MNYILLLIPTSFLLIYPKYLAYIVWNLVSFYTEIKYHFKKLNKRVLCDESNSLFIIPQKNNTYYLCPKENLNTLLVDYTFLNITYTDDSHKFDINICEEDHVFMLKNNYILDKRFVKWYLKTFKNYKVSNKYKLQIIDDFADVFSIDQTKGIFIDSDKYIICNREDAS